MTVNVLDGIETTLTLYHHQIKRGVDIQRQYKKIPLIQCYADELAQVWTNLIHNALQAMSHKGTLTISARSILLESGVLEKGVLGSDSISSLIAEPCEAVQIAITDTGTGIPEEIQQRIFEPFFTTKAAGEGSGLGLDIAKKIIDKHGGCIMVDSVPGKTTFTVTLPVSQGSEQRKLCCSISELSPATFPSEMVTV